MSSIDLHCHSTASDGKDKPEELVYKAKQRGITLLSLTDHDTVDGLGAAEAEAKALGIRIISGLELFVTYYHPLYNDGQDPIRLHLLGYKFNYHNSQLLQELQANREHRRKRIVEMFEKINSLLKKEGQCVLSLDRFREFEKTIDGTIGRPHLGEFLMQEGVAKSLQEAFDHYLHPCYVDTRNISLAEGSTLIRDAGGLAVLAHPCGDKSYSLLKITSDHELQHRLIGDMCPYIDGLECFYPTHDENTIQFLRSTAAELGKFVTGGSDHHGGERDMLGRVEVPEFVGRSFL